MRTNDPTAADIEGAAAGEVDAFARIVRQMQGRVWRYIVLIVRDHALAEDLTQEVFIRVHHRIDTLRDHERFVPWLFTIARNAAYDAGRSRSRRPLTLVGDRDLPETGRVEDPHINTEVHDALDRLDEDLRDALVLVTVIGLTYEEASGLLSVPEGTVKSRVFRARKQMMELLELGGPSYG
ncbi:MAG TPA: sigma-70 family RNA polymerase sigma factor [Acidimicrobiia bacterium]|nr:sigma-70 family RNA polymerase sigma factor [Acidimicrobiia bacterium]